MYSCCHGKVQYLEIFWFAVKRRPIKTHAGSTHSTSQGLAHYTKLIYGPSLFPEKITDHPIILHKNIRRYSKWIMDKCINWCIIPICIAIIYPTMLTQFSTISPRLQIRIEHRHFLTQNDSQILHYGGHWVLGTDSDTWELSMWRTRLLIN